MEFLKKFNIDIENNELLKEALTHSSYSNEVKNTKCYERLEYLGDAVLELVTSDYFYNNTSFSEGVMTKTRANYVCEKALATYAKDLNIPSYILLGEGQKKNLNDTIIADVFEAIIAVIYLEKGYNTAFNFIMDVVKPYILKNTDFNTDYKTKLQEYVQTDRKSVEYRIINETGKPNDKTFEVEVVIDNIVYGKGKGKSKKEAEQMAAYDAFLKCAR